ncbi:BREX system ATP-binding domain-containing protein [Miltoncostaea marina]|uniref:BREX system ATP-binding domain-containing protein n=1 Tax=Miltoncostaea marina TaxID=2843215 RepID=UPI001C3D488E|nr:BREX system ATP-binding domain-containing protein [Miltoncostaea marina]
MSVSSAEWLGLLRREYLDDFVRQGGAAVKFAVVDDPAEAARVLGTVAHQAEEAGYLVLGVDAARVRVHMMQEVFFEVARQVPWRQLARRAVRGYYVESGYRVPDDDLSAEAVAALNGVDAAMLNAELRQRIHDMLGRGDELAKDFRVAMLWLCLAEIWKGRSREDSAAIIEWLQGDLRLISAVKQYLIFRKIGRHNARAMLSSLSAWCRMVGLPGVVLTLDIRRLGVAKRAEVPDGVFYTKAGVLDAYEVLRQLIDATDDLRGMLCVVLARPELFDDDRRGVAIYKALYERVWPDVRLRQRDNPLSALATITGAAA